MLDEIKQDAKSRMQKSVQALQETLTKIRTGRAHPNLLGNVYMNYYGADTPLNQLAKVGTLDARTLTVEPFDKSLTPEIEKAILKAELGLNPVTSGNIIRIPLPPLTEQRRKELVKQVRHEGENARIAIRNIRRDANNDTKELLKEKEINEDEERRSQQNIQELTDQHVKQVDAILAEKEKDLMEI